MPDAGGGSDDPTIPDDSVVFRRVTPEWFKVDPGTGERRLTSAAFSDLGDAMSVAIGVDLDADQHDAGEVIEGHPGYGLVALPVGELRKLGLGVVRSPMEGELCHGDVHGKKTKGTRNKLRVLAEKHWIVMPVAPGDEPHGGPGQPAGE
jgi:hypothetical protein